MRGKVLRRTWAAALVLLGAWGPARLGLFFLFPGMLAWREGPPLAPIFAAPLVSLLFWGAALPLLGIFGVDPGAGSWALLAGMGLLLGMGFLNVRPLPRSKPALLPLGLALLFLGLRCIPLFQAAGPAGAEPAFHAFLARRILECGGWPPDMAPQAPGVPAGGFAPALSFLAASLVRASGGGIPSLPGVLLLLGCLAQWAADVGFLVLGTTLAGPAAGGAAALLLGLASPFPQEVSGWGGAGNLLALAAGCLLLAEWIQGRWGPGRAFFLGATAGAAHPMVGGLFFLSLLPAGVLLRSRRTWRALFLVGLGVFLFSGIPLLWARGPRFTPAEVERAAAWGRETGPAAPRAALPALAAPVLAVRAKTGTLLSGLALLGFLLAGAKGGFRKREFLLVLSFLLVPWLFLTGIPARIRPAAGLFYPERTLLLFLPPLAAGLAWLGGSAAEWLWVNPRRRILEGAAALALGAWAVGAVERSYVDVYLGRTIQECLPAPSDLEVLAWMDRHLPKDALVLTRPDDGGLWVPALAGRRATCFHLVPPLFEEMRRAVRKGRPRYGFQGARRSLVLRPLWTTCPGGEAFPVKKRVLRRSGRTLLFVFPRGD